VLHRLLSVDGHTGPVRHAITFIEHCLSFKRVIPVIVLIPVVFGVYRLVQIICFIYFQTVNQFLNLFFIHISEK
jgi:hypothetical protein